MSKKTIILILIIIIAIAVAFVGYQLINVFKLNKSVGLKNQSGEPKNQGVKDLKTMGEAINLLNNKDCEDIKTSSEFISKDACYNFIAQKTNNKLMCDKIGQQALKDNCYENIK